MGKLQRSPLVISYYLPLQAKFTKVEENFLANGESEVR